MNANSLNIIRDPRVEEKFNTYPNTIRPKMEHLRQLIIDTAKAHEAIDQIEETLKWGEPSYLAKKGSTIRMDWKAKAPDQYAMYFSCTSQLVPTFKALFGDLFQYEKNRAIVFNLTDNIPEAALKDCIEMALRYHSVKDQPFLGKA